MAGLPNGVSRRSPTLNSLAQVPKVNRPSGTPTVITLEPRRVATLVGCRRKEWAGAYSVRGSHGAWIVIRRLKFRFVYPDHG